MPRAARIVLLTSLWLCLPLASAQDGATSIDLTREGVAVRGTAEATLIDTSRFDPQIRFAEPWPGPVDTVRNHIPVHWRDKTLGPGPQEDLAVGGVLDVERATPGALFPGIQQTPWSPPDPTIAVGPGHVLETVNMQIAWYTRDGTLQFSQRLDNSGDPGFFEEIGGGNFTFDPKCFYDHYEGRFVVLALEYYSSLRQSWITIAVSDDSDPNGIWYKYRTDSVVNVNGTTYWVDYPGLGYDGEAYYVTGNLFRLAGNGSSFAGVIFRTFDKLPLLSGAPAEYTDIRDGSAASVQAAQTFGTARAAFFVSVQSQSSLRINAIRDPIDAPAMVTTTVSVPPFQTPTTDAPNQGGGGIDTLDGRIINVAWRNGNLYAGHGIRTSSSSRNRARWYQMQTNTWPDGGSVTLGQSGEIDEGGSVHTWFPAVYENRHGDVGLVAARSSSTTYANIIVTGRKASDPPGTMGATTQVYIGNAGASGRWGDYFDIALDPVDDSTFWVVGEYATPQGWGTWISSFFVTPAKGDLNCDGTVNSLDIQAFVNALFDPDSYDDNYPGCDMGAGDINEDGVVDAFDIEGFLDILFG